MGQIKVNKNVGGIAGLCVIEPAVHGDQRGYFIETYNRADMAEAGLDIEFVQDNQSMSTKGVLRGLHYQKNYPQTKLIRVIRGSAYDVAVDLRPGSPTYGKWYGIELSADNHLQLLIPRGFAHGFLVLTDTAEVCYKCDDLYHPDDEAGLAWNDPTLAISWPGVVPSRALASSAAPDSPAAPAASTPDVASAAYALADGTPLTLSSKDQHWPTLK